MMWIMIGLRIRAPDLSGPQAVASSYRPQTAASGLGPEAFRFYAPAALRRGPLAGAAFAGVRRRPAPRLGDGGASRRASSRLIAWANVTLSGLVPFGIDALVCPSVT